MSKKTLGDPASDLHREAVATQDPAVALENRAAVSQTMKDLAESVRDLAAQRGSSAAQGPTGYGSTTRAKRQAPAPTLIPMPGDAHAVDAAVQSDLALQQMDEELQRVSDQAWENLNKTYVVYVRCPHPHSRNRAPHALYLSEYPRSADVPYDKWFSRQKPTPGQMHYPTEVWCQSCLLDGVHRLARVEKTSMEGAIRVEPRHLWRRPRDAGRLEVEGETRVFTGSYASQNIGRDAALERARQANYEVFDE